MRKWFFVSLVIVALSVVSVFSDGHVETILEFDIEAGELTEGIAIDDDGNIFVSLTPLGQIIKVEAGSDTAEPFGAVEGLAEGDLGLLGLAVDEDGYVYGAVVSSNPEANGVWIFDPMTGEGEHIPGTEDILLANALVVGEDALYVTDSISGAVWSIYEDGTVEVWIQDSLLVGNEILEFGFPIGANGIDISGDSVFVGVLELATIVEVPIMEDGSAGEASVWAQLPEAHLVDGIVVDPDGNIIVAAPTVNEVVIVSDDGEVEALAIVDDGLDGPASVVYYADEDGNEMVYAVNFSVAVTPPGGHGPALLEISLSEDE
jgi:sugar lactone lactonase YvrE